VNLRWARAATKHRISRERSRYVIEHCGLRFEQEPPSGQPAEASTRLVFLGDDAEGVALEVMAVELKDETMLVIHSIAVARPLQRAI
jgi:hypothetical protein